MPARSLLTLTLLVLFTLPVRAADPARQDKTDTRLLLHIELVGDLDCTHIARDLADALTRARESNADAILLEPTGRRWRADVLLDIARALTAEPRLPLLVFLNPPDDRAIGLGQSWLSLLADAAYAAPSTRFAYEPADELAALAPAKTDWDQIDQDLRALAWSRLSARGSSPLLTALCPRPTETLWSAPTGEGDNSLKILSAPPTDADGAKPLAVPDPKHPGARLVSLSTDTAVRLGLLTDSANASGDLLAKRKLRVWKTEHVRISSGLPEARRSLDASLRSIDTDLARTKAALDSTREKLRSKNAVLIDQAKQTATREIASLNDLARRIGDAERVTTEYPELLRVPAPGATTLTPTAAQLTSSWRSTFQDRRDDLAKLRARAQTIIATPAP